MNNDRAVKKTRFGWRFHRAVLIAAAVAALVSVGTVGWYRLEGAAPVPAAKPSSRAGVPVSVAAVVRQDVPLYLSGLGTVQASFTVGIHPQVDGKLQEVLFTEGQHVKKGEVLAKIDPRLYQAALDQAKAKKAQDEALLVAAEKDLKRFKELALKYVEPQQNVDRQQGTVDQLKAAVAADEAMIESAQTNLDYTSITAPSDGRMGVRLIDPGNVVRASDPASIATLTLTQPIAVLFTLPARTLQDVRDAMARGPVEAVAFDQDNRQALSTGKLLMIDNVIDQSTATIRLKAMFPNEDERLWPGEFVNARLLAETRSNAIVVPSSAVQRGPQGLFAWVAAATDTVEPRAIEVGPSTNDLTIITSGLSEGERVVTAGQYKLKKGVAVTVTAPMTAASEKNP